MIFSDLAEFCARDLMAKIGWAPETVDALIMVTQSGEYVIPSTSIILQDRLGLPKTTLAFDINLGCSGYPYGLYTVGRMIGDNGIKRAIVIIGDQSASEGAADQGRDILFGDACSATALEYDPTAPEMYFQGFSDGSGYKAIYVPDGGKRNPLNDKSTVPTMWPDGVVRTSTDVVLDGPAILNFSTSVAPLAVQSICEFAQVPLSEIDGVLLHQANKMINNTIRLKLKLPSEAVPESLYDYGNTSSTSIPITLSHRCADRLVQPGTKWVFCGFGIGLSWASLYMEAHGDVYCSPVLEV